jgi:N-acyl-D-aspartate/D-glutamate deacylase
MTLLIKNVRLLGGSRPFPEPLDVFIAQDKISAIGIFPQKRADQTLDGQGAYLSPGFIDVDTSSDHYLTLFDYPSQADFLRQGITTIFGGTCGSSLAPLLYGSLESVRKWGGSDDRINVDWHTMAEFLKTLDRRPLAVNFGTLVGHSTIRRAIVGDALRDLTKNEMDVLLATIKRALHEGGFGVSTGLGYVHGKNTPYAELKKIAEVVKQSHGIYATHLRNSGEGVGAAIDETIKLAKDTGVKALVSHFVPMVQAHQEYSAALDRIEALPDVLDFRFDLYPFDTMLLPIYTFLPAWAQNGGQQTMLTNLKDEWLMKRIAKDTPPPDEEHCIVAQAPGNDFFVGKTLKEVRQIYGLSDPREALFRLMVETKLQGTLLYKTLDEDLIRRALGSKRSFVASNAPSFDTNAKRGRLFKSDRTTSTFPAFLSLAEHGLMPLEDAIRKITLLPAREFGLVGRGEIKEGNFADLTCFRNGEFKFTVVGGKVAMKEGEFQNVFPGKALRHSA